MQGNLADRESIAEYQGFLSATFFDNRAVALIPSVNKDVLTIKVGDEEEKPVQELGDGIQAIIILTFPLLAHRRENLLVYFEEPELFLHPGLQRIFLAILSDDQFENHQYFIATHSNHLLDITSDVKDVSIYTSRSFWMIQLVEKGRRTLSSRMWRMRAPTPLTYWV